MYNVEIAIEMLQAKIDIVYLTPIMLKIVTDCGCECKDTLPAVFRHITNKYVVKIVHWRNEYEATCIDCIGTKSTATAWQCGKSRATSIILAQHSIR